MRAVRREHLRRKIITVRSSFRIARVAEIDVYVHITFLLLVGWLTLDDLLLGKPTRAALLDVGAVLGVFAIGVLHEYGHALAARRYGIRTERITLLPIGGLAELQAIPRIPRQELVVALAGPMVNLALAVLAFAVEAIRGSSTAFLTWLLWTNVGLFVFNLVPAFPMDGGRVLRAGLGLFTDRVTATDVAAAIGKVFAVIFFFLGVAFNPLLIFIAFFVWASAGREAAMVREEERERLPLTSPF